MEKKMYRLPVVKGTCERIPNERGTISLIDRKTWKLTIKHLFPSANTKDYGWWDFPISEAGAEILIQYFYVKQNNLLRQPRNARPSRNDLRNFFNGENKKLISEFLNMLRDNTENLESYVVRGDGLPQEIAVRTGCQPTLDTLYRWGANPALDCPKFSVNTVYGQEDIDRWVAIAKVFAKKNSSEGKQKAPQTSVPLFDGNKVHTNDARVVCSLLVARTKQTGKLDLSKVEWIAPGIWNQHRRNFGMSKKWMTWEELNVMAAYFGSQEAMKTSPLRKTAWSKDDKEQYRRHVGEYAESEELVELVAQCYVFAQRHGLVRNA